MKHIIGSLFAIAVAGVAAIAATSAWLNSPLNIGPASNTSAAANPPGQTAPAPTAPEDKTPAPQPGAKPAAGGVPDATPRGAGAPDAAAKPAAEGEKADEDDKDPYEGIAPEDLPPDLQYDADSSVSFPTNI
jgi:hypothetical protein